MCLDGIQGFYVTLNLFGETMIRLGFGVMQNRRVPRHGMSKNGNVSWCADIVNRGEKWNVKFD